MKTVNFGAGPAALPDAVMERLADELGPGARRPTILEISHRSPEFDAIAEEAEAGLRRLMGIPDDYTVLFLQGGASLQFAAVPLNLTATNDTADHIVTGHWSRRAAEEAFRYCRVNRAADTSAVGFTTVPGPDTWTLDPDAAYVAYTPNETIDGVEFPFVPDTGGIPIVADMSSTILSRPIDVSLFGLIYAGAQKNLGIAGLTVVIVRSDLTGRARPDTPSVMDYAAMAATGSRLNTPPTFAWFVLLLVLEWMAAEGGVEVIGERNRSQQQRLYEAIDASDLYENRVDVDCRSWTNIPFSVGDDDTTRGFLSDAAAAGMIGLKGHRSVGGARASLYNAMPEEGVDRLIEFMSDFETAWKRAGGRQP